MVNILETNSTSCYVDTNFIESCTDNNVIQTFLYYVRERSDKNSFQAVLTELSDKYKDALAKLSD
jgi:hypothetical protein